MMKRIAVGGIHTECSTYSPVLMHREDFRLLEGEALLAADHFAFLKTFDQPVIPLCHARSVPGGPIARDVYEGFKAEFLSRLKAALPLDGLYLALHGAVNVEGLDDAEADWIAAARAVTGPDTLFAASYDLHGNVSPAVIDELDIFAAYRTAPHIDVDTTMSRAFAMLIAALDGRTRPGVAYAAIPVLLPGEKTSTEDEPAASLYAMLPGIDQRPGILDANIMVGYVWADEPRATAAAIVTATDQASAAAAAHEIATAFWLAREDFRFGPVTGPLNDMLDLAERATTRPVILADSGDNPTGGGVGDRADVLKALLQRGFTGALLAGITDRPAVEACFAAGVGSRLSLKIGGALDPQSPSVETGATVLRLDPAADPRDSQAVVDCAGNTLVLASRRRPYHDIADFTRLGLDPANVRLLVVKSGYLSPELAPIANPNLMALTDGVINQHIEGLTSHRRIMPIYPFIKDFIFTPKVHISRRWKVGHLDRG